jgi:hypothetical protein
VGTADGNVFMLVRKPDGSSNVTQLGGLPANGYVADLAVAPPIAPAATSYVLYAALGSPQLSGTAVADIAQGRIFKRNVISDASWTALGQASLNRSVSGVLIPHTKNPVNAIAVDPGSPQKIYIGCDSGLFTSTDGGTSWSAYSDNLPNAPVTDLQFHVKTKLLRACLMGRSIWEINTAAPAADPPAATIFIRRNLIDNGRGPVPNDSVDPLNPDNHINPFSGADIKIDTPFFGGFTDPVSFETYGDKTSRADYVAFPQLDTSNTFRHNTKSRVYAEIMNRGPADATNVVVRAFYGSKGASGYPDLPKDFWDKFPNSDPDLSVWKSCGTAALLGTIPPAQPKVAMWELPQMQGMQNPIGVLVVATSTEDPVDPAKGQFDVNKLTNSGDQTYYDQMAARHLALREAGLGLSTGEVVGIIFAAVGGAILLGVGAYAIGKKVKGT